MSSRKTQFGFMALGCLVGLLGVFTIHKQFMESKAAAGDPVPDKPAATKPAEPAATPSSPAAQPSPPTGGLDYAPADPAVPLPLYSTLPEQAKQGGLHTPPADKAKPAAEKAHEPAAPPPLPGSTPPPLAGDLPPLPPGPGDTPPPPPGDKVHPLPAAIPEPAPAAPNPPKLEAKPEPLPPPLPTGASLLPVHELQPVPQPPPGVGQPLPPVDVDNHPRPPVVTPEPPPSGLLPVGLPSQAPPPPPPAVLPAPVGTPLPPVGTPLPPVGTPLPSVVTPPVGSSTVSEPMAKVSVPAGEPPLAPSPGPVVVYQVRGAGETMREIARRTLGGEDRWADVYRLNPSMQPDGVITAGASVKLPADACIHDDDAVQPLPTMRPKAAPRKPKAVLPLTGTFAANLDDKKTLLLPRAIRDQLGNCETLLVSPGSDQCLWITNQTHLDRLADRLDHSPARELDVRTFKRLYFAQTEKSAVSDDGRVTVPDKLVQFAGLHQEVMLIGIDDHFEVWDASKWRQYTQQKSAAARAAMLDHD